MRESYDGKIDWTRFYDGYLKKPSHSVGANKRGSFSPFRDGDNPGAFWFNTENGLWKDEVADLGGNATEFLAQIENIDTKEANKRLCILAGVWEEPARKPRAKKKASEEVDVEAIKAHNAALPDYSAEKYAEDKGLNLARLNDEFGCGLKTWKNKVVQPYRNIDGSEACTRFRNPPGFLNPTDGKPQRFSWRKGSSGKIVPYGLWLLPTWPADCDIVLIEGESDCHALWLLGIPALGVPGASYFRPDWARFVEGHNVLIHDEQDTPNEAGVAGSVTFIAHTTQSLADADFVGTVAVFATPGEYKDPSDLYLAQGMDARKSLEMAFSSALPPEMPPEATETRTSSVLAKRGLKTPKGWSCNEHAVCRFDEETESMTTVTTTPVVISRRLVDVQSGEERIELAFLRDKKWRTVPASREAAFTARGIVPLLSPLGVQVTSESAKPLVRWLGALEQANMDKLTTVRAARSLGWCGTDFLPTNAGDVVLDLDGAEALVAAFTPRGKLAAWVEAMDAQRAMSPIFRFMLASGLASPLLRCCKGRNFFVYNWGSSKGGKTAALKAAVSAWGDPEILMSTFNATDVGLERMAGLLRDLPFAIDERQAANGDQRRIDNIVMSLASGVGRVRGARDGGLQDTQHYRSVIIATGEEPLSGSVSKTGVATRVLELRGVPFSSETAAEVMHRAVSEHHGHAGPLFIERLVALGEAKAAAIAEKMLERIASYGTEHASSHMQGISTVLAADVLVSMWIWDVEEAEAMRQAEALGIAVLGMVEIAAAGNVDEAACQWIEDWLAANDTKFSGSSLSPVTWGEKRGASSYLVFPSMLKDGLEAAGFSYRKTILALRDRDVLKPSPNGESTRSERVHNGPTKRVVWIYADKLGAEESQLILSEKGENDVF